VNEVLLQVVFVILVLEKLNYVKLRGNEQFRTVSPMNLQLTVHTFKIKPMAVKPEDNRSNLKVITDTG
jgi:hypothetical protein